MLSIIAQGTAHPIPSYVPWIILLPALAGLVQNFFGKHLPRKGDWLVIGGMMGSLALATMTMLAWLGLPAGDYFRSTTTWFELAQGLHFLPGHAVNQGEVVRRVGILDPGVPAVRVDGLRQVRFRPPHHVMGAPYCRCRYDL